MLHQLLFIFFVFDESSHHYLAAWIVMKWKVMEILHNYGMKSPQGKLITNFFRYLWKCFLEFHKFLFPWCPWFRPHLAEGSARGAWVRACSCCCRGGGGASPPPSASILAGGTRRRGGDASQSLHCLARSTPIHCYQDPGPGLMRHLD